MKRKKLLDNPIVSIRRYTTCLERPPTVGEVEDVDVLSSDHSTCRCQFTRGRLHLLSQRMTGQCGVPTKEATVLFDALVYAIVSVIYTTILNEVCKFHE